MTSTLPDLRAQSRWLPPPLHDAGEHAYTAADVRFDPRFPIVRAIEQVAEGASDRRLIVGQHQDRDTF